MDAWSASPSKPKGMFSLNTWITRFRIRGTFSLSKTDSEIPPVDKLPVNRLKAGGGGIGGVAIHPVSNSQLKCTCGPGKAYRWCDIWFGLDEGEWLSFYGRREKREQMTPEWRQRDLKKRWLMNEVNKGERDETEMSHGSSRLTPLGLFFFFV